MATHGEIIASILALNPGRTFGAPDAFYGHRPIYFTDGPEEQHRADTFSWLKDPEGIAGGRASFAGYALTPTRVAGIPPWDVPDPWLLAAVAPRADSPADIVGGFTYGDPTLGTITWDLHRGGYLTPSPANPTVPVPPGWALTGTAFTPAMFRNAAPAPATPTPAPAGGGSVVVTTTAAPITGNAADRFLVNGIIYDGQGHVITTAVATEPNAASDGSSSNWLLLGGLAAALWYFSHAKRRR